MAVVEKVRVCSHCGHIDPADARGRCPNCDLFTELVVVPRATAERLARRAQRRARRRRAVRLFLAGVLLSGVALWALRTFLDQGLNPPQATTRLSASVAPHAWAQFRRTPQNTGFTPEPAPFPQHVKWTYRSAGPLLASPAVVDNQLYLTTADGRIVALDLQTGQTVWTYHTGWLSSSTPAVAGDLVIFAIRPGLVMALNRHTGTLAWEANLRQPVLASPIIVHGTVYLGAADRKLYALDVATGQQRWTFTAQSWIVAAVAHADDRVIVTSQDSQLDVVGAQTGHRRFLYDTGLGRAVVGSPVIQGERAYFGSHGGRVWAINWQGTTYPLERGVLFWKTNLYVWGMLPAPPVQKGSLWSRRVGREVIHTPAVAHHTVYVATSQGVVVALNAATGIVRWRTELGVDITAPPIVAAQSVLVGTATGIVFALDARTGAERWKFKAGGQQITAAPVVADGTLYVVTRAGILYAVAKPD